MDTRRTTPGPVHGAQFDPATGNVLTSVPWIMKMATHRQATGPRTCATGAKNGQLFVDAEPRGHPPPRFF